MGTPILLLFTPDGPVADDSFCDVAVQEEYADAGGTSVTLTLRQAPVAGHPLVCYYGCRRPDVNLIGPGAGWTKAISGQANSTNAAGIWYKISDGSELEITCTHNAAAAAQVMVVKEYPGFLESPLDVVVSNSSTGQTSLNLGTTAETSQENVLAVALLFATDTGPRRLVSWSDGFYDSLSPNLDGSRMHIAEKLILEPDTVTTTITWETARAAVGMIATFKLSASPIRPAMPVRRLVSGAYATTENPGLTRDSRLFTPTANRPVFCLYAVSNNTSLESDTTIAPSHGGILNWTQFQYDLGGSVARHVYLAYAYTSSSPEEDVITFTFPTVDCALWYAIVDIDEVDLETIIAQYKLARTGGDGGTFIDITQDAVPDATSTMLGIVIHGDAERHTHDPGYHIIEEGACGNQGHQVSAFWLPEGDQTVRVSWDNEIHVVAIVAEIKRAP